MADPRDRIALGRFSAQVWVTTALLVPTVVYAVLQVGFVRPHLSTDPRPNLARPPVIASGNIVALEAITAV